MIDANKILDFRSKILTKLTALQESSTATRSELRESSDVNENVHRDELDFAKAETDRKTALKIHDHGIAYQVLLENALIRMEAGTFGQCQNCRDLIDLKRLEAHPGASLCIECQEDQEFEWAATPAIAA